MLESPPLSLYIHIPWCVRKCPYCDFNSHEFTGDLPESEYIEALCRDFESQLSRINDRPLQSIFIGGGTPSLFSAGAFQKLLQELAAMARFADDIEIVLEANPGTAEAGRFREYRALGINRLSLGVQSFNDLQLQKLGRIHDSAQARAAIDMARAAGFSNFNIDIMHGLPGQRVDEALADLESALAFAPMHLSWYQLTIEPNTVFYSRPPALPAEETVASSQELGGALLAEADFSQYEVSAYAQPGAQSRHNLNYWQFGDYLGIGAGAHGKLTDPASNSIIRTRKVKKPGAYLENPQHGHQQAIAPSERSLEFVLNSLRLRQGFSEQQFSRRTGLSFSTIAKQVECLVSRGLLQREGKTITTTDRGYQLLNSVLEEFL